MGYVKMVTQFPIKKHIPVPILNIELTERCNNNCIHCYINKSIDDESKEHEQSTDCIKKLLKEAADLGCMAVRFTGGEPLLREDFKELYICSRRLGMSVILLTNARLITQELADLFAVVPSGNPIEVTLYGMCDESYNIIARDIEAFKECERGLRLLMEGSIPFILKQCLLTGAEFSDKHYESLAGEFCRQGKVKEPVTQFHLRARRDDCAKNEKIKKLRLPAESLIDLYIKNNDYAKKTIAFIEKFGKCHGNKLFTCGFGNSIAVDAFGNLQGCLLCRHPATTRSVKKLSLENYVACVVPEIKQLTASNPDYMNRCARCFLKSLCGQCPANSWMEYGTLDTPVEYLCDITHATAKRLGLIKEHERTWEIYCWEERIMAAKNNN